MGKKLTITGVIFVLTGAIGLSVQAGDTLCARVEGSGLTASVISDVDQGAVVRVTVEPDHPVGPVNGAVHVSKRTTPSLTELVLPIFGLIEPPVKARPSTILIGQGSHQTEREIRFEAASEYHIRSLKSSSSAIGVFPVADGGRIVGVRVRIASSSMQSGALVDERLTIEFDRPSAFQIIVPVIGEMP